MLKQQRVSYWLQSEKQPGILQAVVHLESRVMNWGEMGDGEHRSWAAKLDHDRGKYMHVEAAEVVH